MPTPHNKAEKDQIAKSVLMPGDPLRAKFIAETFLENPVLVNNVRGINGYTGTWKGVPVTVMASGMGMPSIGIYSYELFKFYDVENIIRVGSAGAYVPELKVFDVVLASAAYSESTFAKIQCGYEADMIAPSAELNEKLRKAAEALNIPVHEAVIHSSDVFYHETNEYLKTVVDEKKCEAVEMESFALFSNARVTGKNAACLLTISDSLVSHEETTAEQREKNFTDMMKIALDAAIA
ncbi:MAG: purine-nucleoside phosphorylase [Solobacterium sp.]|nr:purine-nucleoside phosphorylase [Solobacterium sp.]